MQKHLLTLLFAFSATALLAQSTVYQQVTTSKNNSLDFNPISLFQKKENLAKNGQYKNALTDGLILEVKNNSISSFISANPQAIKMELEQPSGKNPLQLELVQSELFGSDFKISTNNNPNFSTKNTGLHYRGIIADQPNSAVALSVFENEVLSVIHSENGETFVLGKTKNESEEYIFYNKKNLLETPEIECGTADIPLTGNQIEQMLDYQNTSAKVNNCVNVFLECDFTLATEQGGVQETADYIAGLFNVVATLYQNEEITMKISEIMVWESEDPYAATTSAAALDLFKATRTDFNGDLAHLISRGAPVAGGIAWIGGLCSEYNYGYSYIKDFYNELPGYSWSVNVIAHEIGHNLGSPHTHACTWNGNNTPLDGCGSLLGYGEGCSGSIPTDGGTIMSYCHLLSGVGVNFAKGFGQQPGDLIRSIVASASCLSVCEESSATNEECISVISEFPYTEGFENGFGIWNQNENDHCDWTMNSGTTDSDGTGPNSAVEGENYLYVESSRNFFKTAVLETGCINFGNVTTPKLLFNYHMFGAQMGSLEVFVSENDNEFVSVWAVKNNQDRLWETALIDLSAFAGTSVKLKIQATTGKDYTSDIAIDNIRIFDFEMPCEKPEIQINTVDVLCNGNKTGMAEIITAAAPESLTYLWSTGETTSQISDLRAGSYRVTVSNSIFCHSTASFQINQPEILELAFQKNDASSAGSLDGDILLSASGGVPPYEFEWSASNDGSKSLSELSVGLYMATVTDANGCFATETIEIEELPSGCDEIMELPYAQNWENGTENWVQNTEDDFDWTIHSGRTSSSGTGPVKAFEQENYAYIEASNNYYKSAVLTSPCFNLSGMKNPNLTFSYHLYGNQMGTLSLEISEDGGETWTDEYWSQTGDAGSEWQEASLDLGNYTGKMIKIRFEGDVKGGLRSDMAIDAIYLDEKGSEIPTLAANQALKNTEAELSDFTIYPNPAVDETTLSFNADSEQEIHVTIFDISGKTIKRQIINSTSGNNKFKIDLASFAPGLYYTEIQNQQTTLINKFLKTD